MLDFNPLTMVVWALEETPVSGVASVVVCVVTAPEAHALVTVVVTVGMAVSVGIGGQGWTRLKKVKCT